MASGGAGFEDCMQMYRNVVLYHGNERWVGRLDWMAYQACRCAQINEKLGGGVRRDSDVPVIMNSRLQVTVMKSKPDDNVRAHFNNH